jgi:hypothetical protein
MFKQLFRSHKSPEQKRATSLKISNSERCTFSFLWLKVDLINPSWKTIILAVIFLFVVVLIIILLHDNMIKLKVIPSVKTLLSNTS